MMMRWAWLGILLCTACSGGETVMTGADRLISEGWEAATGLEPMAVGVVTNHTGRLSDGTHLVDALLDHEIEVVAIFSPEHGFEGAAAEGARIYSAGETYREVPIHSLYGVSTRPDETMLTGVEVLLFDIQDVGARFYTYTSTMARTMEAAAVKGIPYVVLDRPNPIGGRIIEGPVLQPEHTSFVGLFPVPIRHGFTVGEYAQWMCGEGHLPGGTDLDLRVVRMVGWERGMSFSDTGVPWVQPSPNMATPVTALVYPGICFVEGSNLSEGRGTVQPFELVGAPWADRVEISDRLNQLELPGVRFHPITFTPGLPGTSVEVKWKDDICQGVKIEITDAKAFRAVVTGVAVVSAFRRIHPDEFRWRGPHFDRLAGVSWLREGIEAGEDPRQLEARWLAGTDAWRETVAGYLLYP